MLSETMSPIEVGIVPVTPRLLRSIDTTLELTQVTPVHGVVHTELTGNLPLHRHPITSVLVPRLVDETKSHIARSEEDTVGLTVGVTDGIDDGKEVGPMLGRLDGILVGFILGHAEGDIDGFCDGIVVGTLVGCDGTDVGVVVGRRHS
jgi:hypothetical protein